MATTRIIYTISVDSEGRAYIGGQSQGGDIPIVNAAQPTFGGRADGFVSVLSPAGNSVEWSTYIGGPGWEQVSATAVDAAGSVYVTGITQGPQTPFPATHDFSGGQCVPAGGNLNQCFWVAKYNRSGVRQYSDLYTQGSGQGIAVDSDGSAYVSATFSANPGQLPPFTPGAYSTTCGGTSKYSYGCLIAGKLSPAGDSLIYSTAVPMAGPIQVDRFGNAYIAGSAYLGLPVSSTAFQKTFGGGNVDGYIFKLNATGSGLIWATYLGGSGDDYIQDLVLDQYGQVYVSGSTTSPNFPLKAAIQGYAPPPNPTIPTAQAFVTTLSGSLSSIEYYSTYFGGAESEGALPRPGALLAVDSALNVYLTGGDDGIVQPTPGAYTNGPVPTSYSRTFVSKLTIMDDIALAMSASSPSVTPGQAVVYSISVTSKGPDFGVNVRVSDTLPPDTNLVSINCGGGSFSGTSTGPGCTLPQLNQGATWTVYFAVIVNAPAGTTLSNTATAVSNMQDFVPANNTATVTTKVN